MILRRIKWSGERAGAKLALQCWGSTDVQRPKDGTPAPRRVVGTLRETEAEIRTEKWRMLSSPFSPQAPSLLPSELLKALGLAASSLAEGAPFGVLPRSGLRGRPAGLRGSRNKQFSSQASDRAPADSSDALAAILSPPPSHFTNLALYLFIYFSRSHLLEATTRTFCNRG
jgi:hypothetical protein